MLKNLKAQWAGIFLLCLASTAHPFSVYAEENRQQLVYEVYAGGIHAVQGTLDIDERAPGEYNITMGAKTRGLLGKLAPWVGTFESHGWRLKDGRYQPKNHKSVATWRDETDIKDYHYNKDGTFKALYISDKHVTNDQHDIEKALTDGTTDALSAALEVFNTYNETGKCEGASDVFDGKRRFKQVFVHQKKTTLESSKYNIYSGPAAECVVEVIPDGGEWHEKPRGWLSIQEQGRDRGLLPTVWIAKISETGPAVPVKIRVKTAYGTLFMHLAEYQNADKILVAEKRVKD